MMGSTIRNGGGDIVKQRADQTENTLRGRLVYVWTIYIVTKVEWTSKGSRSYYFKATKKRHISGYALTLKIGIWV